MDISERNVAIYKKQPAIVFKPGTGKGTPSVQSAPTQLPPQPLIKGWEVSGWRATVESAKNGPDHDGITLRFHSTLTDVLKREVNGEG
jgi:hypothetical protein